MNSNSMYIEIHEALQAAFAWRKNLGLLDQTEAQRIYYGPGECVGTSNELSALAIDVFQEHAWITQWGKPKEKTIDGIIQFLRLCAPWGTPIQSVVLMDRSSKPASKLAAIEGEKNVKTIWGTPPAQRFSIQEYGIPYLIQLTGTKHPGLFLDHAPLRRFLFESQRDKKVLNLFAYTGSLSIACGRAGASHVTTLDLSKPTIEWAKENWVNAGILPEMGNFIAGDVFEWLPRFAKKNELFDTIICDPPSFSRTKSGTFSTQKDSARLHRLIFPLLKPGGTLIASINSESFSETNFLADIHQAAKTCKTDIQILKRIDLPESFPTSSTNLRERYLKGFVFLRV